MKIRKFYSRNIQEGFRKVKQELGPEAIIVQSRKVRQRGIKGFFAPRQVEIIAALDRSAGEAHHQANRLLPDGGAGQGAGGRLADELRELKELVKSIVLRRPALEPRAEQARDNLPEHNHNYDYWRDYLSDHDLDPALMDELLEQLTAGKGGATGLSREEAGLILQKEAACRMACAGEGGHRIQVLIGPTGVGKTTTLAKLAARRAIFQKESVGLITIDHYRIGAIEQLRTYAEIIGLPLEVVLSARELPEALKRLEGCRHILVDTAGRATGNLQQFDELAAYMELLQPAEVFLVISATTRWQDIRFIADSFSRLRYNRLIVTKLDETSAYGALLNCPYNTNLPLAFVTNGQRVPEDLKLASDLNVVKLIWGGSRDD